MTTRPATLFGLLALGLSAGLLSYQPGPRAASAAEPPADGSYQPVAPPAALQAALRANLRVLHDWLDQKDYASAGLTLQAVTALAQLHALQGDDEMWRAGHAPLREASGKLAGALRSKDGAASEKHLKECESAVDALAKLPPPGARVARKDFKPAGNVHSWMVLMDGTYVDAKTAKNAEELERLAQALAEEANVTIHLRADAKWRKLAVEMRTAALDAAARAKQGGLEPGRAELRKAFTRCEACHQGYKR